MALSVLSLGAFTTAEKQTLLTAVKAEILARVTGRIQQGNSAGQSYGMNLMTVDELNRLSNALTSDLGMDIVESRVRPDFSKGHGTSSSNWGAC